MKENADSPSTAEIETEFRKFLTAKLYLRKLDFQFTEAVAEVFELDSLNLMLVTFFLEKTYGIKLRKEDLSPEKFQFLSDFVKLVHDRAGKAQ